MRSTRYTWLLVSLALVFLLCLYFVQRILAGPAAQPRQAAQPEQTATPLPFPTPFVYPLSARHDIESLFDHTDPHGIPVRDDHLTIYTGAAVDNDPGSTDDCCIWVPDPDCPGGCWVCFYRADGESWTDLRWDQDNACGLGGPGWLSYDGHSGYDFSCDSGTPVHAAGEGKAYQIGTSGIYIDHGWKSYRTYYWHMGTRDVGGGQDVVPGQQVGTIGGAGHLHFEVQHFQCHTAGR